MTNTYDTANMKTLLEAVNKTPLVEELALDSEDGDYVNGSVISYLLGAVDDPKPKIELVYERDVVGEALGDLYETMAKHVGKEVVEGHFVYANRITDGYAFVSDGYRGENVYNAFVEIDGDRWWWVDPIGEGDMQELTIAASQIRALFSKLPQLKESQESEDGLIADPHGGDHDVAEDQVWHLSTELGKALVAHLCATGSGEDNDVFDANNVDAYDETEVMYQVRQMLSDEDGLLNKAVVRGALEAYRAMKS